MYGVVNKQHIFDSVDAVCTSLGNGKHNAAHKLVLGTIATETNFSEYKDPTPFRAGSGLCQFDFVGYQEVIVRTKERHKKKILNDFDIVINKVTYEMLEYNPLLSIIFCRLFYKLIPDEIRDDLYSMSHYWKKYYNTIAGKGTQEKFVSKYNHYVKGSVE